MMEPAQMILLCIGLVPVHTVNVTVTVNAGGHDPAAPELTLWDYCEPGPYKSLKPLLLKAAALESSNGTAELLTVQAPLFFTHIPKTGGSSLQSVLGRVIFRQQLIIFAETCAPQHHMNGADSPSAGWAQIEFTSQRTDVPGSKS